MYILDRHHHCHHTKMEWFASKNEWWYREVLVLIGNILAGNGLNFQIKCWMFLWVESETILFLKETLGKCMCKRKM